MGSMAMEKVSQCVAVVSGNTEIRRQSRELLKGLGYSVNERTRAAELIEDLRQQALTPEAILFDLTGNRSGLRPLERLLVKTRPIPVIALSTRPDTAQIVRAMKLGVADFLSHPLQRSGLRECLDSATSNQVRCHTPSGEGDLQHPFLFTACSMKALQRTAGLVADTDIAILIGGESGSGKEVLARYIHQASARRSRPFIKVNCAALPDDLLESELFGHEQGAFTGAVAPKPGKFEIADGGTILLDEIAEMRWPLQAKLLHVLQDGKFSRLGGNREIQVDVRVLSSTNRDLEKEIEEGRFREDLYFRLKVIDLHVPPLRERPDDIPLLVDHFLAKYAASYRRPVPDLSQALQKQLLQCPWPGNVRELENVLKAIVILGDEEWAIREVGMKWSLRGTTRQTSPASVAERSDDRSPPAGKLDLKEVGKRAALEAESELILTTLKDTRWNRRRTARILGVSYKTLLTKMKRCGLSSEKDHFRA